MKQVTESQQRLTALGRRLRNARLASSDTMAIFAERLGVSEGTVRAMERGSATVQIGTWCNALWVFDRLDELEALLQPRQSLLERARAERQQRRRAPRRRR